MLEPNFQAPVSLELFRYGANFDGHLHHNMSEELFTVPFSIAEYNSGKSSKTWAAILSDGSTWRKDSGPTKLEPRDATSLDALPCNNLGEPQRSYAINAIDRALKFWKAKPVRKPTPLRAPWLLAPNWTRDLRKLLTSYVHMTKQYNITLQTPSTGVVFPKYPSVMDSLCNHKDSATCWADGEPPICACSTLRQHSHQTFPADQHLIVDGDTLHFTDQPLTSLTSIATGSLQNKIFPPSKEILKSLRAELTTWTKKNSLPSPMHSDLEELWTRSIRAHHASLHDHITHKDITRFKQLTTLPQRGFPQRGQTCYFSSNILPNGLLRMPHQDLRRYPGLYKAQHQPEPDH